jgi:hypothetical protein
VFRFAPVDVRVGCGGTRLTSNFVVVPFPNRSRTVLLPLRVHLPTSLLYPALLCRYNQYQTDPYAESDPWGAIAARGDLSADPYAGGGYDTKITNRDMFFANQASVVNGPTAQDQVQRVAEWLCLRCGRCEGLTLGSYSYVGCQMRWFLLPCTGYKVLTFILCDFRQ